MNFEFNSEIFNRMVQRFNELCPTLNPEEARQELKDQFEKDPAKKDILKRLVTPW